MNELKDLIGKQIDEVYHDRNNRVLLKFTDGSHVVFHAVGAYDGVEIIDEYDDKIDDEYEFVSAKEFRL